MKTDLILIQTQCVFKRWVSPHSAKPINFLLSDLISHRSHLGFSTGVKLNLWFIDMFKLINDQFITGKSPPEIIIAISGSGMKYLSALLRKLMVTVKSAISKSVACNLYRSLCCLEVIAVLLSQKTFITKIIAAFVYQDYLWCSAMDRFRGIMRMQLSWAQGLSVMVKWAET